MLFEAFVLFKIIIALQAALQIHVLKFFTFILSYKQQIIFSL